MAGNANNGGIYKQWITPEGLEVVGNWCRIGYTDIQIAEKMGITERTLYLWKNKFPEFKAAMDVNKLDFDIMLTEQLLKRGQDQVVKEKKVIVEKTPSGEQRQRVEESERYIPADVNAIKFWLMNRHPDLWRNSSTEYSERIKAETAKLKAETERLRLELNPDNTVESKVSELLELIKEQARYEDAD